MKRARLGALRRGPGLFGVSGLRASDPSAQRACEVPGVG
jgi:hypothetical protein